MDLSRDKVTAWTEQQSPNLTFEQKYCHACPWRKHSLCLKYKGKYFSSISSCKSLFPAFHSWIDLERAELSSALSCKNITFKALQKVNTSLKAFVHNCVCLRVGVCLCVRGLSSFMVNFCVCSSGKHRLAEPLKPQPGNAKWQRGSWCHITSGQPSLPLSLLDMPPHSLAVRRTPTAPTPQRAHPDTGQAFCLNFSYSGSDTHLQSVGGSCGCRLLLIVLWNLKKNETTYTERGLSISTGCGGTPLNSR